MESNILPDDQLDLFDWVWLQLNNFESFLVHNYVAAWTIVIVSITLFFYWNSLRSVYAQKVVYTNKTKSHLDEQRRRFVERQQEHLDKLSQEKKLNQAEESEEMVCQPKAKSPKPVVSQQKKKNEEDRTSGHLTGWASDKKFSKPTRRLGGDRGGRK